MIERKQRRSATAQSISPEPMIVLAKKKNKGKFVCCSIMQQRRIQSIASLVCLLAAIPATYFLVQILGRGRKKGLKTATSGMGNKNTASLFDSRHPEQKAILEAKYFLIDVAPGRNSVSKSNGQKGYGQVTATFCPLDWNLQKSNPSAVPMFREMISKSKHCRPNQVQVDLRDIVKKARQFDAKPGALVKSMKIAGAVFHETRCGSTLVANLLSASFSHRVYSESPPPINALRACESLGDDCDFEKHEQLIQDVFYLMGRTASPNAETHVFYKIQSIGSRHINAFTRTFPKVPWVFVYRDTVEILMSHLKQGDATVQAVCLRSKQRPPPSLLKLAKILKPELTSLKQLSNPEFCALHLASLAQAALQEYHDSKGSDNMGKFVNYASLPDIMWSSILPDHFDRSISEAETERLMQVSKVYSKAGKKEQQPALPAAGSTGGGWKEDSSRKQQAATKAIRNAANLFVKSVFDEMEKISSKVEEDGDDDNDDDADVTLNKTVPVM